MPVGAAITGATSASLGWISYISDTYLTPSAVTKGNTNAAKPTDIKGYQVMEGGRVECVVPDCSKPRGPKGIGWSDGSGWNAHASRNHPGFLQAKR